MLSPTSFRVSHKIGNTLADIKVIDESEKINDEVADAYFATNDFRQVL